MSNGEYDPSFPSVSRQQQAAVWGVIFLILGVGCFSRLRSWFCASLIAFAVALFGWAAVMGLQSGGDTTPGDQSGGSESGGVEGPSDGACFVAGTPVILANGTFSPIENVQAEDLVLSRDEETGDIAPRRVIRQWTHSNHLTLLLQLTNGAKIETTKEHRFAVQEGGFVAAGDLKPGIRLATQSQQLLEIFSIEQQAGRSKVYNLSVEGFHTYFVGEAGLWVHNDKKVDEFGDLV